MRTIFLILALSGIAEAVSCSTITLGMNLLSGGSLNGFAPMPTSDYYTDISTFAVSAKSTEWVTYLRNGADRALRPPHSITTTNNWGEGWDGRPFHVYSSTQPRVAVGCVNPDGVCYGGDPGPIPLTPYPRIGSTQGPYFNESYDNIWDKILIVMDRDNCLLHEAWNCFWYLHGLTCSSLSTFDMLGGDKQRPYLDTSASVAGVPIFPGLIRQEELEAGEINHALVATALPGFNFVSMAGMATHHMYGGAYNADQPPLGARFRLKSDFDTSTYEPQTQVIMAALKKYGFILIDGGGTIDIEGTSNNLWDYFGTYEMYVSNIFNTTNFEAIDPGTIRCDEGVSGCPNPVSSGGTGPTINSFTGTANSDGTYTLRWSVTGNGSRLAFITPKVGGVVTNSVKVPAGTYTLMVQNVNGRSTANVTVP